jgi:hypothetical protein
MNSHLTDEDLVLHYYGELDEPAAASVTGHLADCRDCRASFARLQRTLALVAAEMPEPELSPGFEQDVWRRLALGGVVGRPVRTRQDTGSRWSAWRPRLAWGAAAATLLLTGVLVGRFVWDRPAPVPESAEVTSSLRERVLLADLDEHFDRSSVALVELVNAAGTDVVDMESQRARAEELLAANRLYRQAAAETQAPRLAEVLEELERVLVDVAASPSELPAAEAAAIGRRIESQNLIFKVRVLSSFVKERQRTGAREASGQVL